MWLFLPFISSLVNEILKRAQLKYLKLSQTDPRAFFLSISIIFLNLIITKYTYVILEHIRRKAAVMGVVFINIIIMT